MTDYKATLRGYSIGDFQDWEWTTNPQIGFGEYDTPRTTVLGRHGTTAAGPDRGGSTIVEWDLEYIHPEISGGARASAAELAAMALRAAWAPYAGPGVLDLEIQLQSGLYVYRGRPLKPSVLTDEYGVGVATVRFDVTDPLLYGWAWSEVLVTVSSFTGGFDSPVVSPIVTTSSGSLGDATVINEGTADAPWIATIKGPVTNPRLILNGKSINIIGDIPAGSDLIIDSRTGRAELDGGMRPWIAPTSEWWDIPPGSSALAIRATAGTGFAVLRWRNAYY